MDFNALITTFSANLPSASSFLAQTIVSAFISAMFSNRSDKNVVIYNSQVDFLNQTISQLHEKNALTATEYLKCKNLADIAKLADEARANYNAKVFDDPSYSWSRPEYDFDWFWRFFERAGYASNDDMKKLWAAVLNGEIDHSGQFSYKAIETLFHMGPIEARVFKEMAQYSINTPYGECLLPSSEELYDGYDVTSPCAVDGESDIYGILAAAYGITTEKIMYLDEYGLVSSMLNVSSFTITHDPIVLSNDHYAMEIRLKETSNLESLEFVVTGHRFSSVARQLFAVIDDNTSLSCFLDYARLIERRYSEVAVNVFKIVNIDKNEIVIDDSIDYLHDLRDGVSTRLDSLGDFTIA